MRGRNKRADVRYVVMMTDDAVMVNGDCMMYTRSLNHWKQNNCKSSAAMCAAELRHGGFAGGPRRRSAGGRRRQ